VIDAKIVNRFKLNGTIDGHDPIGVTWRIKGAAGYFRITFITVNWGRGYHPGEFHANVMNVLNKVGEREYVVLLIQELDEADGAPERKIFIAEMEPGTTLIPSVKSHRPARETIAVSPGVKVTHPRLRKTMGAGLAIGANPGTGPTRFFVSCYITVEGIRIFVGNQHPHRVDPHSSAHNKQIVNNARREGEIITSKEVHRGIKNADMAVYGGDMNDDSYPKVHHDEEVAYEVGLDTLRWVLAS
jgi:hypothetical protein